MRCQERFSNIEVAKVFQRWHKDMYLSCRVVEQHPDPEEQGIHFSRRNWCTGMTNNDNDLLNTCIRQGAATTCEIILSMLIYSQGLKVFKLDHQNLEAMENIDIHFGLSDYSQPYETLIIEFDEQYSKNRIVKDTVIFSGEKGDVYPVFGVIHRLSKIERVKAKSVTEDDTILSNDYLLIGIWNNIGQVCSAHFWGKQIIEDMLTDYVNVEQNNMTREEIINTAKQFRACLNACSMLMEIGISNPIRSNLSHYNRCIKQKRLTEAELVPLVLSFNQKVRLFSVEDIGRHESNNEQYRESVIINPHWRRGYRRRQHYGPNNMFTKIVTIKPVLVNKYRYGGDNFSGSVEYS